MCMTRYDLLKEIAETASTDECLPWPGATNGGGYGAVWVKGRTLGAHKVALEVKLGRVLGEGMQACHTCDNPICVNPRHLFEGTDADNKRDMACKGRRARGEKFPSRNRLTEIDVMDVIERIEVKGEPQASVAREYGVTPQLLHRIRRGKAWGWLTGRGGEK